MRRASLLLLLALTLAGCGQVGRQHTKTTELQPSDARAGGAAADQSLPERLGLAYHPDDTITVEREGYEAGPVDFHGGASFEAAASDFARETDAALVKVDGIPGAIGFRVDHANADNSIERWNRRYLSRGAYVFRYMNSEGYSGGQDGVILLPTRDKWTVIRAAAVNGVNYDILTPAIVKWLKRLDAKHPFTVYGAGIDFVEGRFATAPRGKEALALAKSMYRFCPDIVDQGTDTVPALARELEQTGTS